MSCILPHGDDDDDAVFAIIICLLFYIDSSALNIELIVPSKWVVKYSTIAWNEY